MAKENNEMKINSFSSADINESYIREYMPEILDLLLIDRTTSTIRTKRNIIWANENYIRYGVKNYSAKSQIKPELVTGSMSNIIKPRSLKSKEMQKERTKAMGEVFTPTWIVKKQNDEIDKNYKNDSLETYVGRTWIEVACGEAPYMVSRYDMESGRIIPLNQRVGFVDRKLKKINKEVNDKAEWQRLVVEAFKSSYGFEWSGDSLLLARENLLYSYRDFYYAKWLEEPLHGLFKDIAEIISYNVFQMDGLKYIIPLSEKRIKRREVQLSLFQDEADNNEIVKPGKRVKIMNWRTNKVEYFDKGVK
ncbi:restriction endonuclease [Staphylococcus pseudintermedius]|uniref:restriction endonuclease n=1 Tax=Staphylococcus pseudintermedius TaxID=283734 RepID=UPI000C6FF44D|nr:restriction endonuclease [Staphylococcus pseudintermedius]EGQ0374509.1 restriction endonuclease [Staphylococcus pseudintermedius]EGQ1279002.1 restriction endonuclease [Staphylococcus pseudintermedius]EGQ1586161.1 restriction endonuclease [Staphylococcus pseudintermedius]EGQ1695794.1 restriction endonuclease [Staphylococcus pseudintermedius]EGQ2844935.1 restriction endonuclease [Staphylococcus pseudintermedius]